MRPGPRQAAHPYPALDVLPPTRSPPLPHTQAAHGQLDKVSAVAELEAQELEGTLSRQQYLDAIVPGERTAQHSMAQQSTAQHGTSQSIAWHGIAHHTTPHHTTA